MTKKRKPSTPPCAERLTMGARPRCQTHPITNWQTAKKCEKNQRHRQIGHVEESGLCRAIDAEAENKELRSRISKLERVVGAARVVYECGANRDTLPDLGRALTALDEKP